MARNVSKCPILERDWVPKFTGTVQWHAAARLLVIFQKMGGKGCTQPLVSWSRCRGGWPCGRQGLGTNLATYRSRRLVVCETRCLSADRAHRHRIQRQIRLHARLHQHMTQNLMGGTKLGTRTRFSASRRPRLALTPPPMMTLLALICRTARLILSISTSTHAA
jgi:hypothetical protein